MKNNFLQTPSKPGVLQGKHFPYTRWSQISRIGKSLCLPKYLFCYREIRSKNINNVDLHPKVLEANKRKNDDGKIFKKISYFYYRSYRSSPVKRQRTLNAWCDSELNNHDHRVCSYTIKVMKSDRFIMGNSIHICSTNITSEEYRLKKHQGDWRTFFTDHIKSITWPLQTAFHEHYQEDIVDLTLPSPSGEGKVE